MPTGPDYADQPAPRAGKQSRTMSLVEAATNVVVGYVVAVLTQFTVFPLLGIAVSVSENLLIGCIFTAASIVRSYLLRRVFEVVRYVR
jgi:hypothetical protein